MSAGKNIVLGVTGSIAAYKAAELTSRLTKQRCVEFVPQMRRAAGDLAEAVRGREGLGP